MAGVEYMGLVLGVLGAGTVMACALYLGAFLRLRSLRAALESGHSQRVSETAELSVQLGESPGSYATFAQASLGEFARARDGSPSTRREEIEAEDYWLCSRVLIAAFENDSVRALNYAERLVRLPLSSDRHQIRRSAVVSVARVMAGVVDEEDWELLGSAPSHEPALLWPCRYAVASVLFSSGRKQEVPKVLGAAPPWPRSSHFAALHARLTESLPLSHERSAAA